MHYNDLTPGERHYFDMWPEIPIEGRPASGIADREKKARAVERWRQERRAKQ